jgi:hypothetical protein
MECPHPSIHDNFDPDSNLTEESEPHQAKQFSLKTSTDEETIISTKPALYRVSNRPLASQ